jgi:hypothetical protein
MKEEKEGIYEIKEKAKLYFSQQVFSFVKEQIPKRQEFFYNGFITKIYDDFLEFYDVSTRKKFPILFETITAIEPSKRSGLYKEEKEEAYGEESL